MEFVLTKFEITEKQDHPVIVNDDNGNEIQLPLLNGGKPFNSYLFEVVYGDLKDGLIEPVHVIQKRISLDSFPSDEWMGLENNLDGWKSIISTRLANELKSLHNL